MFHWVAKNSKFDKTDPHCSAFLLIYCKLKTNFIAKSQLLYMGCPLTRDRKQKKNRILIFKSVHVRLRESVRLREFANTEFNWEVKRGFEKVSESRMSVSTV